MAGSHNEHPEVASIGWKYAIHPESYRRADKIIPNLMYNKMGWFFKRKPMSVITKYDKEDIVITHKGFQEVKQHIRNGKPVKAYVRKIRTKPDKVINAVFTQGIKPVRFIYETKKELEGLFKTARGSNSVEEFYRNLKKLKL